MQDSEFTPLFLVLMAMVFVWFGLLTRLFRRLEERHPGIYESMGRPTLFKRNNSASTVAMLKFIAARQHRSLGDDSLSKLSDFMLLFIGLFLVLSGVLLFGMITTGNAGRV